jgi:ribosomal protein S24E
MKMEILNEYENKLLHRKELDVLLKELTATPSRKEIMSFVAANIGAPENLIVLGNVHQKFGKREVRFKVKVYENEEKMKSVEPKPKEKKKEGEAK